MRTHPLLPRLRAATGAALATLLLAGCSPQLPTSPEAAKKQLKNLGSEVLDAKDQVQEGFDKAGAAVSRGVDATKDTLTTVGDGVLTVTGNEDKIKKKDAAQ